MCGGTKSQQLISGRGLGLSPRVRGNPLEKIRADYPTRSIPACAGEPSRHCPTHSENPVYPRVCGGTNRDTHILARLGGLSPRVRGNRPGYHLSGATIRSIPACAGEPRITPSVAMKAKVYPRVCGGTITMVSAACVFVGLSPRVRGNRRGRWESRPKSGSIPACAGEPMPRRSPCIRLPVYPRVCGGTFVVIPFAAIPLGLSPRVRGNRHRGRHHR